MRYRETNREWYRGLRVRGQGTTEWVHGDYRVGQRETNGWSTGRL